MFTTPGPDIKHKWQDGTCVNCGLIKEVIKTEHAGYPTTYNTLYFDKNGKPLAYRPKCSGKIKSPAVI